MLKKQKQEYYNYREIAKLVEQASGKDLRDWAGKFPKNIDYSLGEFPTAMFAKSKGYDWKVLLDNPDGTARVGDEMALRMKINKEYRKVEDQYEPPYQDFWNYAIDHIFHNVRNGSYHWFNPWEILEDIKDKDLGKNNFVKDILPWFIKVFEENHIDEEIQVLMSW